MCLCVLDGWNPVFDLVARLNCDQTVQMADSAQAGLTIRASIRTLLDQYGVLTRQLFGDFQGTVDRSTPPTTAGQTAEAIVQLDARLQRELVKRNNPDRLSLRIAYAACSEATPSPAATDRYPACPGRRRGQAHPRGRPAAGQGRRVPRARACGSRGQAGGDPQGGGGRCCGHGGCTRLRTADQLHDQCATCLGRGPAV